MAFFKSKNFQGKIYDLGHLEPFRFRVTVGQETFVVHVEFTCHCFTTKFELEHTPDFLYEHKDERRAFDIERHALSLLLPDYIRGLTGNSVYWSNKGSFFFWRSASGKPYLVFFTALKADRGGVQVRLKVESAHIKPQMTRYASPIEFSELMRVKAKGEVPDFGPKVEIKRK